MAIRITACIRFAAIFTFEFLIFAIFPWILFSVSFFLGHSIMSVSYNHQANSLFLHIRKCNCIHHSLKFNSSFTTIKTFTDHLDDTRIDAKMLLRCIHTVIIRNFIIKTIRSFYTLSILMIISKKCMITALRVFLHFCWERSRKLHKRLSSLLPFIWSTTLPSGTSPLKYSQTKRWTLYDLPNLPPYLSLYKTNNH